MKTDTPRSIRLEDYRPPSYLIDSVSLDVALDATRTRVKARSRVRPNASAGASGGASGGALVLDGEMLELESIKINGRLLEPREYQLTERSLVVRDPPDKPFTLETVTFCNPEANKALQGLYRSRGIYCTQCEAQGFRRITYFLDRPDVLATYTTRIEAAPEEAPVLLSNGNLVERGTLDRGRRHYAVWRDPHPKPSYLFALVGGVLSPIASQFRTVSGRKVDLTIYVEPGKEERAHWAMDSLKRSMTWDERRFGREYDLDVFNIVAVSDFNLGAMENKGLNIFNDRLILASPETATDAIFEAIEAVVAHEYFHNWTGNRITCRDWFQLCLKEGLTVFRDQEFSADERDPVVQRITDVRQLKAHQFPEDAGPLAHPVRPSSYIEINNFYTATVYEKGAEIVRMIQTILGRDGFRAGMDLYFERHDGEAATVEAFLKCFEDATGEDLAHFFRWYTQAGTPTLVCALSWDRKTKRAILDIEQVNPATSASGRSSPLDIPVKVGLVGSDGRDLPLVLADGGGAPRENVVRVRERKQSFVFEGVPSRPWPSLLRGFSAPVNLSIDLSDRDLEFLMRSDSDLYNRWHASQTLAVRTLTTLVAAIRSGKRSSKGAGLARALGETLRNEKLDPAYRAEFLKLPTEADLAREIGRDVDPEAIHRARKQLCGLVARVLGDDLVRAYDRHATKASFSPDAKSAGKRALRNAILSLLMARGRAEDLDRLAAHYWQASNMTDQAHALYLASARHWTDRLRILDDFFGRWQDDHVVIDTWFTAQAISPLGTTLDTVKSLTEHPRFSFNAPNKVRALIAAFAMSNPLQFNRADGKGYRFLADMVIRIDSSNPQVAARMLGAYRSWRTLEPARKRAAKRELQRIAKTKPLSNDTYEMVHRMLE